MKMPAFKSTVFSAVTGVTVSLLLSSCGEKETAAPAANETQKIEKKAKPVLDAGSDAVEAPAPPAAPVEKKVSKGPFKPAPIPKMVEGEPFVLEDLSQIKVTPGSDSPKVGDTIYTYSTLPEKACGEYWVLENDKTVSKLAVCTGDHAEGEGHH